MNTVITDELLRYVIHVGNKKIEKRYIQIEFVYSIISIKSAGPIQRCGVCWHFGPNNW